MFSRLRGFTLVVLALGCGAPIFAGCSNGSQSESKDTVPTTEEQIKAVDGLPLSPEAREQAKAKIRSQQGDSASQPK